MVAEEQAPMNADPPSSVMTLHAVDEEGEDTFSAASAGGEVQEDNTSSRNNSVNGMQMRTASQQRLRGSIMDPSGEFIDMSLHQLVANTNDRMVSHEERLATKENRVVSWLRTVVLVLLSAVTLAVCLTVYFSGRASQEQDFEDDFAGLGAKLVESFEATLRDRIRIINEFAQDLTAYSINGNHTFPFVTLPDYERRAGSSARMADLLALLVVPIVSDAQRPRYEQYTQDNIGWRAEGIAIQDDIDVSEVELDPIYQNITGVSAETGAMIVDPGPGPYLPIWQVYPAIPAEFNVNVNLNSPPLGLSEAIDIALEHKHLVMPRSYDFLGENANDPRKPIFDMYVKTYNEFGLTSYEDDPAMTWFYPVFDNYVEEEDANLVALLIPDIYWKTYFRGILPNSIFGIFVILENSCGQAYTYRVDGKEATFVGHGDQHDPEYNELVVESNLVSVLGRSPESYRPENAAAGNDCLYGLRVYPSRTLEESYQTNEPWIYSTALGALFLFTSLVFMLYDYFVSRRQKNCFGIGSPIRCPGVIPLPQGGAGSYL